MYKRIDEKIIKDISKQIKEKTYFTQTDLEPTIPLPLFLNQVREMYGHYLTEVLVSDRAYEGVLFHSMSILMRKDTPNEWSASQGYIEMIKNVPDETLEDYMKSSHKHTRCLVFVTGDMEDVSLFNKLTTFNNYENEIFILLRDC